MSDKDKICDDFCVTIDIANDLLVFKFSDGTIKKCRRGLFLYGLENEVRKQIADQIRYEAKKDFENAIGSEQRRKEWQKCQIIDKSTKTMLK